MAMGYESHTTALFEPGASFYLNKAFGRAWLGQENKANECKNRDRLHYKGNEIGFSAGSTDSVLPLYTVVPAEDPGKG
jgi:hypothetical protein